MSERNHHGIDSTEDATRERKDTKTRDRNVTAVIKILLLAVSLTFALGYLAARSRAQLSDQKSSDFDRRISENAQQMMVQGKQIFRYDTFGDEVYWSDKLKLHQAIQGTQFGGVGPGVSPKTALAVGLSQLTLFRSHDR